MTLKELLDHLRQNILRDTSDRVEGDDPRLWSDNALVAYLNDAQRIFAKKSLVMRERIEIVTAAYEKTYDLPSNVFAVISAKHLGNSSYVNGVLTLNEGLPEGTRIIYPDQVDLGRTGHAALETWQVPDGRWFDINRMDRLPPGKPIVFDTDEFVDAGGEMVMRLYPVPDVDHAGCLIQVRAINVPDVFVLKNADVECELPIDYHLQILDYAAFKALSIVDHEASDPQRAQGFKDEFDRNCEIARREMLRKMFVPQQWGFGSNGFSYEGN